MFATPLIRHALGVAAEAHQGQKRKGRPVPYIIHPVSVAMVLMEFTDDEATLAAALLHDVLEDCQEKYSEEQMRADFSDEITDVVTAVTKDDSITDWRQRNEAYLATLRASKNEKAALVCVADKICNLTDTLEDYVLQGDDVWKMFTTGSKADQLWWYGASAELMNEMLPGHRLATRLNTLVGELQVIITS